MINELKWTGERLVTDLDSVYGTFEHLHRYAVALELCKDRIVLDIASGEGYGTDLLSSEAKFVWGVDISEEVIIHAKKKYTKHNIEFIAGSATSIPLPDDSVDLVVSFETLEHLIDQDLFLSEIKRVLKKDGILVISTPDKNIYHERDGDNPFHLKELMTHEFEDLIRKSFVHIDLLQQRIFIGSVISLQNRDKGKYALYDGGFSGITHKLEEHSFFNKPFFNLIVATDLELKELAIPTISLFSAYKTYKKEKQRLLEQASLDNRQLSVLLNTKTYKSYNWLIKKVLFIPVKLVQKIRKYTLSNG